MSLTFQNNSQVWPTRMTHEFHPQNAPCSPRSLVHSVVGKPNQNNKLNMLNMLQKKTNKKQNKRVYRAYFRIQGKYPLCSKRASYFCNTSWLDSPKLMKELETVGFNRLSSLHIPLWHITLFTFFYFHSEIMRIPDKGRSRDLYVFYAVFKKLTEIPPLSCKIHGEHF